jgi:hypothetical protein
MTTHINGIVQLTRQMHNETSPEYPALYQARFEAVLAAIKDGVEPDLISWAIGMNDSAAKVQMQFALAHMTAASALDEHESRTGLRYMACSDEE